MQDKKAERAKIFLSFDSLKGFSQMIKQKQRVVVKRKELSPDSCDVLNYKVHQIKPGKIIKIIYYNQNEYIELEGMVAKIDLENKKSVTIVNKEILFKDIIEISGDDIFENE